MRRVGLSASADFLFQWSPQIRLCLSQVFLENISQSGRPSWHQANCGNRLRKVSNNHAHFFLRLIDEIECKTVLSAVSITTKQHDSETVTRNRNKHYVAYSRTPVIWKQGHAVNEAIIDLMLPICHSSYQVTLVSLHFLT